MSLHVKRTTVQLPVSMTTVRMEELASRITILWVGVYVLLIDFYEKTPPVLSEIVLHTMKTTKGVCTV